MKYNFYINLHLLCINTCMQVVDPPTTMSCSDPNTPAPTTSPAASFQIPTTWRPSIMSAIKSSELSGDVRNETLLYTYEQNPCASHCKKVAAMLVSKYPFMADSGMNKTVRNTSTLIV